MALTFSVQVRPPPLTVIVVTPPPPSLLTIATSSDPGGGVNAAVTTVTADVVDTTGGADASSASVPAVRISSSATPLAAVGVVEPTVTAPGVPVRAVVLHVPYRSLLTASAMLSIRVVDAFAVYAVLPVISDP